MELCSAAHQVRTVSRDVAVYGQASSVSLDTAMLLHVCHRESVAPHLFAAWVGRAEWR